MSWQSPSRLAFSILAAAVFATALILSAVTAAGQGEFRVAKSGQSDDVPEEIERLAREYRIQVYNAYRLDRAEYDRRRAAWDKVLAAWQESGRRPDDVSLLAQWLLHSTHYAAADPARPIAPVPTFGIDRRPSVAAAAAPEPPLSVGAGATGADSPSSGGLLPDWLRFPPFAWSATDDAANAHNQSPETIPPPLGVAATPDNASTPLDQPTLNPPTNPSHVEFPVFPAAPGIDVFSHNSGEQPPSAPPPADLAAAATRRPIAATDLFGEFAPTQTAGPRPDRHTVHVNLDELAARIKGYNLALQAIDVELLRKIDFDATDVARILTRMDELLPNYQNVVLYWNVISADERSGMSPISSAGDIIASLADRLIRLRRNLDVETDEPAALRRVRHDLLDSLTRRLTDLAERYRTIEAGVIN